MKADTTSRPRLVAADAIRYLLEQHGIPVAKSTLKTWAWRGGGPGYQKSGPRRLYPVEQLDEWAKRRLSPVVASTSELTSLPTIGRPRAEAGTRCRPSAAWEGGMSAIKFIQAQRRMMKRDPNARARDHANTAADPEQAASGRQQPTLRARLDTSQCRRSRR